MAGYINGDIEYTDAPVANSFSYRVDPRRFASLRFEFTGALDRDIRETTRLIKTLIGVDAPTH